MSGWRKIEVDGVKYLWRGHSYVMVKTAETHTSEEKKFASATACQIKGITWNDWERGHWKKTPDGSMTAGDVTEFIRRVANGEKFETDTPALTRKQKREDEMAHIVELTSRCLEAFKGTGWTVEDDDRKVVEMTVAWTYNTIREEGL